MSVKIYVDLKSQPCRALTIFLKSSDIPFELKSIELFEGEQKKPEYVGLFPRHTVPGMSDGDYHIGEAVAIFRYLTSKYAGKFPDHWYPADLKARGRVDEYLSYHHAGTRMKCVAVFVREVLMPAFGIKVQVPEEQIKEDVEKLSQALDKFEKYFIKDSDYICGNEVSFADVMAVCEMSQYTVGERDILDGRPRLKAYVERVKYRLNPIYDEVHAAVYAWRDSTKKK